MQKMLTDSEKLRKYQVVNPENWPDQAWLTNPLNLMVVAPTRPVLRDPQ